jgi:circadian clock protein KaiB
MSQLVLKLFITGRTSRSQCAIANLRRILDEEVAIPADLTIVDVLEQPQLAEEERILVTPTLIRALPAPCRRLIGDLSDRRKVLHGLDLQSGA